MSDLHKAAQQALDWLYDNDVVHPTKVSEDLRAALAQQAEPKGGGRLPPPLQAEPVTEDMKSAVRWAPSSAYWSERLREFFGPDAREGIDALERRIAGAQERAEPDLSRCPQCNGPADNGHNRSIPPHPYLCTKCMAEMPQPSYNVTVVDDAHPNGIPLEQWQNKPVQKPVATVVARQYDDGTYAGNALDWAGRNCENDFPIGTNLYTAPPQRKPLTEEEIDAATAQERDALLDHIYEYGTAAEGVLERIRKLCRATERAHGIKE
jgi:hypothetical protein